MTDETTNGMEIAIKGIIEKKRYGRELDDGEIEAFIDAYMAGTATDAQASALAMAVCCNGMNRRETDALTRAMLRSGETIDWGRGAPTADKHSTGGVGDKLSFIVQPVAAACGLRVPSLVGRALGYTGGTADKLESIPGCRVALSLDAFRATVEKTGLSMATQTAEIAPADRKLYALRDTTGTVASQALITASILSKKLAEGAGALVFDVRCGRGAFMKTREEAESLAAALTEGAKAAGRKASAFVTPMDAPIGRAVGNAVEVAEALDILRGRDGAPVDVRETALVLASEMVSLAKDCGLEDARAQCEEALSGGAALARFEAMVEAQGGSLDAFERMMRRPCARFAIQSPRGGYVADIDASVVAESALSLGAGRERPGDAIDPLAGIILFVRSGEKVSPGSALATLQASGAPDRLEAAAAKLVRAFSFTRERRDEERPMILSIVR